jgi:Icc-related predicted phosphoesterase
MKNIIKSIGLLSLLLAIFMAPSFSQGKTPAVRFAIIGDRTGEHVSEIYEGIVDEIETLKPEFVFTVGDMIEGYTADTVRLNNEWIEYKEIVSKLSMPIYFTPGNHDITTDAALGTYQKHIGQPYYSKDISGIHFIVLDNSRWETSDELPKEQLDWLTDDLKKNRKASHIFVFHHKPFWYNTTADGKPDTLHSLFKAFGVDAIFTGHFHQYFSGVYDGIYYTGVGSSGGATEPGPTGIEYHYVWVTVSDKEISIAPIKRGSVIPWDEVAVPGIKFADVMDREAITFKNRLPLASNLSLNDNTLFVQFKNLNSDMIMRDTIVFEESENWSIYPPAMPIEINPRDSFWAVFHAINNGPLYPLPIVSARFPFDEKNRYKVRKSIGVEREAFCYNAENAPVIDGRLTETIWENPETVFFTPDGGPMATDSSFFYFAYDNNALYVAAYCCDNKIDSMVARSVGQDAAVFGEDCVGFFFQPDVEKRIVYQIYINPLGTVFDQRITPNDDGSMTGDKTWNGTYEIKTFKGEDFWSVEARIPFEQLQAAGAPGKYWGLNFRRKQPRIGISSDWQAPIDYDPATYGRLTMK